MGGPFYMPSGYRNPYGQSIADLMIHQGDVAAQRAGTSGAIWGSALANVGNIVAGAIEQHQAKKDMEKQRAAFAGALSSFDPADPKTSYLRLVSAIGPDKANDVLKGFGAIQNINAKPQVDPKDVEFLLKAAKVTKDTVGDEAFARDYYPDLVQRVGPKLEGAGLKVPPPEEVGKYLDTWHEQFGPQQAEAGALIEQIGPGGQRIKRRATAAELRAGVPVAGPEEKTPAVGSFEDYLTQKFGARPTAEQIASARKDYGDAGRANVNLSGLSGLYQDIDPKAIADSIQRGELPPNVTDLGRPAAAAVSSELAKRGFNLSAAKSDWGATQKHLATLNGAQQTRLRQAVYTARDSLDVIDGLAKEWKGGRFPMLNRAQLKAAKGGALGKDAQRIATQLDAQITDVVSELGNVYMGGNSPTDHALGLAQKNLSADWSLDQLLAATQLARKNLTIRSNSIESAQAIGVSGPSRYNGAPSPEAPAPAAAPKKNPFR